MSITFSDCVKLFAGRNRNRPFRRLSYSCTIRPSNDGSHYIHRHHNTDTVLIYPDRYVIYTGGWDTFTTWQNIRNVVPYFHAVRPRIKSIMENKLVGWYDAGKWCYSPFYEGIEVNLCGVPFDPKPCTVRRLKKGETRPFNALAKKVREILGARVKLGEWDNVDLSCQSGWRVWILMEEIATRGGPGLFTEWIDHDTAAPLFAYRGLMTFGKPRDDDRYLNSAQRLESNIRAAYTWWIKQHAETELVEKEYFR